MSNTHKEFHFTDEQIDVLLEALIWTIDNGNYTDEEHKCARELYVTKLQSYSNWQRLMKNYRVRVETFDGLCTIWYEKSKAKTADKLILNRVYNQLCGLNIKEISVEPTVWNYYEIRS